jgi:RNA recognition motif-containing protein
MLILEATRQRIRTRSRCCYRYTESALNKKLPLMLIKEQRIFMSIKLYVGNLSFQTSNEDLADLFSQAGTVESASVVEDRDTGRSRGFAFVEMSTKEEGEAAISLFNGRELNGRNLNVNEAKPREARSGGGFGGGRGGSKRGGYGGGGGRGGSRW